MTKSRDLSFRNVTAGFATVLLSAAVILPAAAQSTPAPTAPAQTTPAQDSTAAPVSQDSAATAPKQDAADKSTYATGQPLGTQSKEGFWGHVNPLARKKWVKRQIDPVKDRVNELDQLQAKNSNDIKDVDSRASAGIRKANDAASLADQHAQAAGTRADAANGLATSASSRTDALHGTVTNLDQYQTVSATSVPFVAGHTTLGKAAKANLDEVAEKLASEKGYIIEVQGYSRAGVANSQAMADSVVRYLVAEHQVPVYRIYRTGLGKVKAESADGEKPLTNGVRVTLLHNSLAAMGTGTTTTSAPAAATSSTGSSKPSAN